VRPAQRIITVVAFAFTQNRGVRYCFESGARAAWRSAAVRFLIIMKVNTICVIAERSRMREVVLRAPIISEKGTEATKRGRVVPRREAQVLWREIEEK
jgi:hypothetical protein